MPAFKSFCLQHNSMGSYLQNVHTKVLLSKTLPLHCRTGQRRMGGARIRYRITRVNTSHRHPLSGRSCGRPTICGSTAGARPLCRCTSHCPGGWCPCPGQRKTPPGLLQRPHSRAACTPPGRLGGPRHRHTPCPNHHYGTAPLGPRSGASHPTTSLHLQRKRQSLNMYTSLL